VLRTQNNSDDAFSWHCLTSLLHNQAYVFNRITLIDRAYGRRRIIVALGKSMPHKRSPEKSQLRRIQRIIFDHAFNDRLRHETICRLTRSEVLSLLNEPVLLSSVPEVERGEVLIDSRGTGTYQRTPNATGSYQVQDYPLR
jgi:regulator of extracellular matrix RemA (YlzA/DUF370 family)